MNLYDNLINNSKILIRDRILVSLMLLFAITPTEIQSFYKVKRKENNTYVLYFKYGKVKYKIQIIYFDI